MLGELKHPVVARLEIVHRTSQGASRSAVEAFHLTGYAAQLQDLVQRFPL